MRNRTANILLRALCQVPTTLEQKANCGVAYHSSQWPLSSLSTCVSSLLFSPCPPPTLNLSNPGLFPKYSSHFGNAGPFGPFGPFVSISLASLLAQGHTAKDTATQRQNNSCPAVSPSVVFTCITDRDLKQWQWGQGVGRLRPKQALPKSKIQKCSVASAFLIHTARRANKHGVP